MLQLMKHCMSHGRRYGIKHIERNLHVFTSQRSRLAESKLNVYHTFCLTTRKCSNQSTTDIETTESNLFQDKSVELLWEPVASLGIFIEEGKHFIDLIQDEEFQQQINSILENVKSTTTDDLVSTLHTFKLLKVPLHHPFFNQTLDEVLTRMKDDRHAISLKTLASFTCFAHVNQKSWPKYYLCIDVIPRVLHFLKECETLSDLNHITICFNNLNPFFSEDIANIYLAKLNAILNELNAAEIDAGTSKQLFKIVNFLIVPFMSPDGLKTKRRVMLLLKHRIPEMTPIELARLSQQVLLDREPAKITSDIFERAQTLLKTSTDPELYYCSVANKLPENRMKILRALEEKYETENDQSSINFNTLRLLRFPDAYNTYNIYWKNIVDQLSDPEQYRNITSELPHKLSWACSRYCFFNESVGCLYRYLPFEATACKLAMQELKSGLGGMILHQSAKLFGFVIAYGRFHGISPPNKILPEFLISKLEKLSNQLTVTQCGHIARGLDIFTRLQNTQSTNQRLSTANQLCRIENVLSNVIKRHLDVPNISLSDLSRLMRAHGNAKSSKQTEIFNLLVRRLEKIAHSDDDLMLNSRIISDTISSLGQSIYIIPELFNKFLKYIYANREYVDGNTIGKVLYTLYQLGFEEPDKGMYLTSGQETASESEVDVNFEDFNEIIHRDFNFMTGISIVKACLALSFYRALSTSLIERVFNLDFIIRLEEDIKISYSKDRYSRSSLKTIMELNRAVCFGYPEARVPWFQQNYIEAHLASVPKRKNNCQDEVLDLLLDFIGDKKLLQINHVTPYGYRLEFVLHFNKKQEVVPPTPDNQLGGVNKIAILLLNNNAYCNNKTKYVRGEQQLRERHLSMLGYHVVQVCSREWNSMYMSLPGAKMNYLKGVLGIE